jgi:membrane-associated protein
MLDTSHILQTGSLILIGLIIFAESGLLLGLFLPGDTLLIAGGIFAAQNKLSLGWLICIAAIATIAGYQVGYKLGERVGPRIFTRQDGILFRRDYMRHTEDFFRRHGWKTLLIARFIAVVRTIVPLVAGMGKMDKHKFLIFNALGGFVWSAGLIFLSFEVGARVPHLDRYIEILVLTAVALTWFGLAYELYKKRARRREIFSAIREEYRFFFKKN